MMEPWFSNGVRVCAFVLFLVKIKWENAPGSAGGWLEGTPSSAHITLVHFTRPLLVHEGGFFSFTGRIFIGLWSWPFALWQIRLWPVVSCWVRYLWPLSWKEFLRTFSILQAIFTELPSWGARDGSTLLPRALRPAPRRTFAGGSEEISGSSRLWKMRPLGATSPFLSQTCPGSDGCSCHLVTPQPQELREDAGAVINV